MQKRSAAAAAMCAGGNDDKFKYNYNTRTEFTFQARRKPSTVRHDGGVGTKTFCPGGSKLSPLINGEERVVMQRESSYRILYFNHSVFY